MSQGAAVNFLFHLVDYLQKVLSVLVLQHRFGQFSHFLFGNPAIAVGYTLQASHLQALAFLYHHDVGARFGKAVVGAGVEPGETAAKGLDLQLATTEVFLVH